MFIPHKKGQITLFIIIGILILISAILFVYFKKEMRNIPEPEIEIITSQPLSINPIKLYIEACIENTAKNGIFLVSVNGGYISPSGIAKYNEPGDWALIEDDYYYFENANLPYLINKNIIKIRSKNEIEKILSNYITVELDSCLTNFSPFKNQGFIFEYPQLNLTSNKSNVSVLIEKDSVSIKLYWPIVIKKEDYQTKIDTFQGSIDLRIGMLYSIAQQLIADISRYQPFDISEHCKEYLPEDNLINIYLESNPYTYEYVIRIVDAQPLLKGSMPLKFQFAVKNKEVYGECVG